MDTDVSRYGLAFVAASGLASVCLIAALLRSGRAGCLDQPNERSLHSRPVPRSGGLGILLATAIGMVVGHAALWLWIALALLAVVSWFDDQRNLPIVTRFASHFLAAGIAVWSGSDGVGFVGMAVAVVAIVWMTNLYNFMDGANGLAGGMAVFGFAALGLAALDAGAMDTALLAGCIAAGAGGFLVFNFHPARIFMGDVGAIPVGFLAAVLGLEGLRRGLWPLWFAPLAFSPFIVDATVTVLRRTLRGERIWLAHREHYYQRLVRMGWSHRHTALAEYALMAAAATLALVLRTATPLIQGLGLGLSALLYLLLAGAIDRRWRLSGDLAR